MIAFDNEHGNESNEITQSCIYNVLRGNLLPGSQVKKMFTATCWQPSRAQAVVPHIYIIHVRSCVRWQRKLRNSETFPWCRSVTQCSSRLHTHNTRTRQQISGSHIHTLTHSENIHIRNIYVNGVVIYVSWAKFTAHLALLHPIKMFRLSYGFTRLNSQQEQHTPSCARLRTNTDQN